MNNIWWRKKKFWKLEWFAATTAWGLPSCDGSRIVVVQIVERLEWIAKVKECDLKLAWNRTFEAVLNVWLVMLVKRKAKQSHEGLDSPSLRNKKKLQLKQQCLPYWNTRIWLDGEFKALFLEITLVIWQQKETGWEPENSWCTVIGKLTDI